MKAMIVAAGLATLSALASAAPMQAPGQPPVLTDIRWDILPPDGKRGDEPRLRVRSEASSRDFALDGSRPERAGALRARGAGKGTGRAEEARVGEGWVMTVRSRGG